MKKIIDEAQFGTRPSKKNVKQLKRDRLGTEADRCLFETTNW